MQEAAGEKQPTNKKSFVFAAILLLYQVAFCAVLGTVYGFNATAFTSLSDYGGMILVGGITILLIIGFGLINAYVVNSSISGMVYTLLIYCITIQHFYFFRAFWNDAGANDEINSAKLYNQTYEKVTMSNYHTDRQVGVQLNSAAWVEGIACAIALNVAVSPVLGRIGLLQVFFLTLFGTFFYQVNSQLLWRWFVADTGYGYRIFLFGAIVGIISTLLLGRKQTVINHQNYLSNYKHMALGLLGFAILWCAFPLLVVAGIYTQTMMDNLILYAAPVNMWLALISGILGTFTASALTYRKFSLHDLVFTGLTGGIIFSSSSDVNWNPATPLIVGFIIGFLSSFQATKLHRNLNSKGIIYAHTHLTRFLLPGIVAAILVAVLQATGTNKNGDYDKNYFVDQQNRQDRSYVGQGAFQILAMVVTAAIAALAGIIIGICYKIINKNETQDQYNNYTVISDVPLEND